MLDTKGKFFYRHTRTQTMQLYGLLVIDCSKQNKVKSNDIITLFDYSHKIWYWKSLTRLVITKKNSFFDKKFTNYQDDTNKKQKYKKIFTPLTAWNIVVMFTNFTWHFLKMKWWLHSAMTRQFFKKREKFVCMGHVVIFLLC